MLDAIRRNDVDRRTTPVRRDYYVLVHRGHIRKQRQFLLSLRVYDFGRRFASFGLDIFGLEREPNQSKVYVGFRIRFRVFIAARFIGRFLHEPKKVQLLFGGLVAVD